MSYFSLHTHNHRGSNVVFLDSTARPEEIVAYAREIGLKGVCCSDHASISAWIDYLQERDKIKAEGNDFKIMLGVEAYLIDESEYKNTRNYYHFILIAKDQIGQRQLFELTSKSWDRSYMERGIRRVPMFYQDIEALEDKGHLVALSACLGGRIPKLILEHDTKGVGRFIGWCVDNFGEENFFLEIQPNDHSEEQKIVNRAIIKISQQVNIPYVITTDVHYVKKEQQAVHAAFLNSREARGFRETAPFYDYTYIMTPEEIYEVMGSMGLSEEETRLGLENTELVANLVTDFDIRGDTIVPQRKLPEFELEHTLREWYGVCPSVKYFSESPYAQDRYLLYAVEQGIKEKKYTVTETVAKRLDTEFDVLICLSEAMGQRMSAYLNLVQEIVDVAWAVSFVGVSRGSAASFLTNYLIGIVQIDALEYGIPYWRFLNKSSVEGGGNHTAADTLADIDEDYNAEKADDLMKTFREHWGEDCVINTLTYKTESLKSAILTSMRGLGYNSDEAKMISALVPISRGHVYSLAECEFGDEEKGYEAAPALVEKLKNIPNLYETVKMVEGLVSGISQHASAVYWCEGSFLNYCGVMRTKGNVRVSCFDYRGMNSCHGLKMDILFTDCQTKLMKCMDLMLKSGTIQWQGSLRATYNKYLHPSVLKYNDPVLWENLWNSKVADCFQFDSPQGSVCIKRTRPTTVKQLGAANAVMRLMGQEGKESPLDRYVRFRNNISLWYKEMEDYGLTEEEQKVLKEELEESFGVGPEQENVMLIVQRKEIANFTLGEANGFRRAISKKKAKLIEQYKKRFFEAADDEE